MRVHLLVQVSGCACVRASQSPSLSLAISLAACPCDCSLTKVNQAHDSIKVSLPARRLPLNGLATQSWSRHCGQKINNGAAAAAAYIV